MEHNKYYFITVFESIEGFVNYEQNGRCVGFLTSLEEAKKVVETNKCDICETVYEYALIEEYYEGIYPIGNIISVYKWDNTLHGYKEIDKPVEFEHLCNFSIG